MLIVDFEPDFKKEVSLGKAMMMQSRKPGNWEFEQ
jgi:hypothetical protein